MMDSNTKKFALIGKGISYSLSKVIHEEFFERLGVNAIYDIIDTDDIESTIEVLKSEYNGFNVTKPYKVDIIKYLDEIDDGARLIGSVNTVTIKDGKLKGYNTDINGIEDTFIKDEIKVTGKNCLVVGYGGVARTLVFALKKMGAKSITVTGRNLDKMKIFKEEMSKIGVDILINQNIRNNYDILVNCTVVGTMGEDKTPIDVSLIPSIEYCFDLVYSPRETALLKKMAKNGTKTRDGLYMLVSQAGKADEFYLDNHIDNCTIFDVYLQLAGEIFKNSQKMQDKAGICLVGFMGSGKSTIGKKLAEILGYKFIDTDNEIERKYGPIPLIFDKYGEEYFRKIENKVFMMLSGDGVVVSTGGGIVMHEHNMHLMRHSHLLNVFLDAPFDILASRAQGKGRPLFDDTEKAQELFDYRYPRYMEVARRVDATQDVLSVIDDILKLQ